VLRLCEVYPGICLTTEEKAWKNLSQGSRRMPVGKECTEEVYVSVLVMKTGHYTRNLVYTYVPVLVMKTGHYTRNFSICTSVSDENRTLHAQV
jgi:hypothetical protein